MLWTIKRRNGTEQNVSIYPSSRATFIWDLWFFSEMLEVVLRENDLIWFLFWFSRLETRCQVSEKLKKLQRQRSARRDKSSGPLPFLFDVLYFCIFKIHFPSQIQLCVCLQDFARIWPDSGQTPWGMVWRSWFLLRFRAYLVESGLRSLFIIKIFRLDFSSRFCPDTRGFRSDPMRYGLGKLVFLSFSSLSRRIRTPESLEDFDDILHLQAFSFIFFFKISGRSS